MRVEELYSERDRLEAECQEMGATQSRTITLEALAKFDPTARCFRVVPRRGGRPFAPCIRAVLSDGSPVVARDLEMRVEAQAETIEMLECEAEAAVRSAAMREEAAAAAEDAAAALLEDNEALMADNSDLLESRARTEEQMARLRVRGPAAEVLRAGQQVPS